MTEQRSTIGAVALLDALHALQSFGLDTQLLLRGARIDERSLTDAGARVGADAFARVFDLAEELSGDGSIGLHAGQRARMRDLLTCLVLSCTDVEEGLRHACRFPTFVIDTLRPELHQDEDHLVLTVRENGQRLSSHVLEYVLVLHTRALAAALGKPPCLRHVRLRHRGDGRIKDARRAFGCAATFQHEHPALLFSVAAVRNHARPVNPLIGEQIEKFAAALSLPAPERFCDRVAAAVRALLAAGCRCDRPAVCRHMQISDGTMARALEAEQATFPDIRETVLMETAQALLLNSALEQDAIAICLGFGNVSAFAKRFKSRVGSTPAEYREQAYGGLLQ